MHSVNPSLVHQVMEMEPQIHPGILLPLRLLPTPLCTELRIVTRRRFASQIARLQAPASGPSLASCKTFGWEMEIQVRQKSASTRSPDFGRVRTIKIPR